MHSGGTWRAAALVLLRRKWRRGAAAWSALGVGMTSVWRLLVCHPDKHQQDGVLPRGFDRSIAQPDMVLHGGFRCEANELQPAAGEQGLHGGDRAALP